MSIDGAISVAVAGRASRPYAHAVRRSLFMDFLKSSMPANFTASAFSKL
jgi:hypothetical protein